MKVTVIEIQPERRVVLQNPVDLHQNPGQPFNELLRRTLAPKLVRVTVIALLPVGRAGHANIEGFGRKMGKDLLGLAFQDLVGINFVYI